MIDSVSVANFEKNLPRFSTPLEFDRPRAQTHKVEKPPSGTDLGVTVPAPPRDPVVNRVELDELAATQKPLLPDNARSKLEEIIQDIQAGRVSRKKIGNYSYVDLPQVDTGSGRGRWRVAIEKGGKTNGHDIFIVRGIYDYHGSKPVAWGM